MSQTRLRKAADYRGDMYECNEGFEKNIFLTMTQVPVIMYTRNQNSKIWKNIKVLDWMYNLYKWYKSGDSINWTMYHRVS